VSTAQDLPVPYGEPLHAPTGPLADLDAPALRLVPPVPLDFDEAVRRIRPRLHRYAVRRLGDIHEAEELVQEALLRAYSNRIKLLTEDDLAAWATVVTGRLVIDRLRVRGRSVSVADVPEGTRVGRDTADVVVARDEARLALDSLDAMHPRQAALLWAREVEGQSYDALCTRFSMTEPAVRSVLTRARKALRKEYALRGGTLPVGGLAVLAPWVAGLGWADRLRRVAAKVSAPAALSAVGITALGGLVLSPFSVAPGHSATTFRPAQAVVVSPDNEVRLHPGALAVTATKPASHPTTSTPDGTNGLSHLLGEVPTSTPCVNDTDSDDGHDSLPVVLGDEAPTAGSSSCDAAQATHGNILYVSEPLPANPTGFRYVSVTSDYAQCPAVPTNPVIKCTPETQPGAQK
jgi:RNA polymerase sigma-70 factor (ECF subfamily)